MVRKYFLCLAVLALTACAQAQVTARHEEANAAATAPPVVYVADFDLQAGEIQSDSPLAGLPRPGLLGNGPLGLLKSRESQARSLVDLMASTIVADLAKAGIPARRWNDGTPVPTSGWMVRGAFLTVDEGNRLRRAVIGFGSGQTDLQVATSIDQLSAEAAPAPLYQVDTAADSGRMPGAIVTLNPYAAAARFVLSGHDLDRGTKATAGKIAEEVAQRLRAAPPAPE
ncbi:DUF4410 domain-containing protein [Phaeospirillum tilakii]|uniref:DUF4410 domain-containing protein n=1 Tax=Phaeospirillum tilakii TaxID=741673 RepID=A0ABW5C614_9PROT